MNQVGHVSKIIIEKLNHKHITCLRNIDNSLFLFVTELETFKKNQRGDRRGRLVPTARPHEKATAS